MSLPAATSATSKPTRIRTSSMSSTKFPFPEGSFAPAQLSATQIRTYEKQIQILMNQALNECDRADTLGHAAFDRSWDIVGAQDGVTALRRREINTTSRSQYRVIGNIACEYKDLMELYYAERSEELYEWLQFMFHHTLDAQVIQTIETATTQNPHHYFGVKWAVFQTSKMGGKVDQTFIEYMTYRKDIRGRDVGIRVTLPIRLAEIDHTMDALKIRRLSSQMVQIVRPITEGQTRMFVMIDNDEPLSYPAAYAKTLLTMSQNFPTCIDSRRIRRRGLKPESRWVTNHARRSCVVCTNTFGAMRGRHHCRLCGEVICRKCMLVRETAEPVTHKTFKIAVTKFCVLCIANIRRGPDVDDLTASRLVSSSKVREMEFAPADLEQLSCVSITSETESEDCRADFDFDSARSSVSSTSEQDSDKHSFGKRLEEITEHNEDTISEDGVNSNAKPTTGRKAKPELVLFVPDETTDTAEFMVTIDTKDMQRERRVDSDSQLSSSSVSSPNRSRTSSWNKPSSTRSIDQCLAEQEALLRQMVLATHGTPMHRHDPQHYEYDA